MNVAEVPPAILATITEYDRRESRKKHYNRHALGMYARGLQHIRAHVANGADLRDAILAEFVGILADRILKACDLPLMTDAEARGRVKQLPELDD